MKKHRNKYTLLLVCLLLTVAIAVSGTIAYLFTSSDPVVNTFTPVLPEIEIPEDMPRACGILSGSAIKKAELLPTETEIKDLAFIGCWKLREITIPEGVTKIGYGAFSTCESLRKIVLPEGLEEIYDKAFYGCRNLRTVVVPKSLKYVGAGAFADCPNLGVRTISKLEGKGEDIYAEDAWD
mgnify:CR=1 FL=1